MTQPDGRPWLVLVTGEPGSGKTSLGSRLAAALRVPFFSRDQVRGGLLATAGLWTNQLRSPSPREAAVESLVTLVEVAAGLGITVVLELVVTSERLDAFRRIEAAANIVVILTVARDSTARAELRDRSDRFLNRPEVLAALGHRSIDDYVRAPEREIVRATMRSELEIPTLRVATDDGYDPTLDAIVDWVVDQTGAACSE